MIIPYLTTLLIIAVNGDCSIGWKAYDGACYLFKTEKLTWLDASSTCQSHHGDLVKIDTPEEQSFLQNNTTPFGGYFWIGARDDIIEGTWMWSTDDTVLDYTHWAPSEPNDSKNNEDCAEMDDVRKWQWNDEPCDMKYQFICEKQYQAPIIG